MHKRKCYSFTMHVLYFVLEVGGRSDLLVSGLVRSNLQVLGLCIEDGRYTNIYIMLKKVLNIYFIIGIPLLLPIPSYLQCSMIIDIHDSSYSN